MVPFILYIIGSIKGWWKWNNTLSMNKQGKVYKFSIAIELADTLDGETDSVQEGPYE